MIDSNPIRLELFKFTCMYNRGKSNFELNMKADAFEALDTILSMLHAWFFAIRTGKTDLDWFKLEDQKCDESSFNCIVHQNFFLNRVN